MVTIRKELLKTCEVCGLPVYVDEFIDELSEKVYNISGLCQKCQNDKFNPEV